MAAELTALLERLSREVRGARGAVLLGRDGSVLAQAWPEESEDGGVLVEICTALLTQIGHLATEADLGAPRRFSLRGEHGQLVVARTAGGLSVGVMVGPAALGGQVRRHLEGVLSHLERA